MSGSAKMYQIIGTILWLSLIHILLSITSVPMLVVIVAAGLVGGLIGGFIGQKALKKHFIKAGLVSVK